MLNGIFIVDPCKVDKFKTPNLNSNFCCRYYIWTSLMNKTIVLFLDIMNFIRHYIIGSCRTKKQKNSYQWVWTPEDNFRTRFFLAIALAATSLLVYELHSLPFSKFNIQLLYVTSRGVGAFTSKFGAGSTTQKL